MAERTSASDQHDQEQPDAQQQPGAVDRARSWLVTALTSAGGRGGAIAILVVLVIGFSLTTDTFLSQSNLLNILQQYSVVTILAVAQTIVIISAGIDLSVAATAALAGSVVTVAYAHWGLSLPVALVLGLAAGTAVGLFNGFMIAKWRVPDIIATLGTFTAVRGVALLVTNGLPVPSFEQTVGDRGVPPILVTLGAGSTLGIPNIVLVAGVAAIVGWFILRRTTFGRSVFAVGGNREAAHASGIDVSRTKLWIYVLSAFISSVAGFVLAGRLTSANALMGTGMELQSIAAVVVGGTALFGGEGSVWGSLIGILIIGVLANGLTVLGISEFWQRVLNGLIIVLVVALDQWRRRLARRQREREAAA